MQGKASRKSDIDEIVFNQRHPNGQKIHAWKPKAYNKEHLAKKLKKYSHFQTITINNNKHFFRFHIKQYWHIHWVTPKQYDTFPNIKQYWHFQRVSSKLNYSKNNFLEYISHNNDTFRELLANNIGFFRTHIKQYSHFHRVITKE